MKKRKPLTGEEVKEICGQLLEDLEAEGCYGMFMLIHPPEGGHYVGIKSETKGLYCAVAELERALGHRLVPVPKEVEDIFKNLEKDFEEVIVPLPSNIKGLVQ